MATAHRDRVGSTDTGDPALDTALDEALARIAQLSRRLHAVTDLHAPRRTVLGARACRACGRSYPCPTSAAAGAASRAS